MAKAKTKEIVKIGAIAAQCSNSGYVHVVIPRTEGDDDFEGGVG